MSVKHLTLMLFVMEDNNLYMVAHTLPWRDQLKIQMKSHGWGLQQLGMLSMLHEWQSC